MSSEAPFESRVKDWVRVDNELHALNARAKELRELRNSVEDELLDYVKSHNMNDAVIQIHDGKLAFKESRTAEPLTLAFVENTLRAVIANEDQVTILMDELRKRRGYRITPEIKRTYTKSK